MRTDTQIICQDSVSTSQRTQAVSRIQTGQLMLYMEVIRCFLWGSYGKEYCNFWETADVFIITANVTYNYHWTSNELIYVVSRNTFSASVMCKILLIVQCSQLILKILFVHKLPAKRDYDISRSNFSYFLVLLNAQFALFLWQ